MPYICPQPLPPILLDSMSQTMLLSKRLTTFLSQNASVALPSLLLLSPTGKLLSSSSPLQASTLRTQATLACSLWALYQPQISSLAAASLPTSQSSRRERGPRGSDSTLGSTSTTTAAEHDLSTITIQLSYGIMVIRSLSCGLLFVAIGPDTSTSSQQNPSSHNIPSSILSRHTSPPSSPPAPGEYHSHAEDREHLGPAQPGSLLGGASVLSDAGSVRSTATTRGSIMGIRRQAEEVGKWLDGQLDGFVLNSAER